MMKLLLLSILFFNFIGLYGQNCDCQKEFDFLVNKIENDYAGFQDKVNAKTLKDYQSFTAQQRKKIQNIRTFNLCMKSLDEWLNFFNDKHLSLGYEMNVFFTFKNIDENATLLRIPGFSWDSKEIIDTLISNNFNAIISKPILIIDLRGNSGGTDYAFEKLLPLIYSNPYISKGVEYWASKGNISIFENSLKKGEIIKGYENETQLLVDSMKAHINSFFQNDPNDTVISDKEYPNIKLVGVIVDDFCASSCEQFVLAAKNSNKTTVFGTRTMGVLDYSNTVPVNLLTDGFFLRYPMTRSTRLPENPVDLNGIQPDIEINKPINFNVKDSIDDWVLFVNDYLKNELKKK